MKLPNGYGSVSKLSGNRRKPYMIRKQGKIIGYTKTRKEGLEILADLNKNGYSPNSFLKFSEVFELLKEHKFPTLSKGVCSQYRGKYKLCESLYDIPYREIRTYHFIEIIETQKSDNAKKKTREFFRAMDQVAMEFDVINKEYSGQIPVYRAERKREPKPFSEEEINLLWDNLDVDDTDLVLIQIYTGLRSGELSGLLVKNINLEDNTLRGGNKTAAGRNRIVPIHPRIKPLIETRLEYVKGETFLNYSDKTYRIHFKQVMQALGMSHIPHECRHTMRTRLDNESVNPYTINLIMGHAGNGVGERVYTHKTLEQLKEAVNKLK